MERLWREGRGSREKPDWGVWVRDVKRAHLTVLNSAYTSRFFPALGHSRNTSSGTQRKASAL